MTSTARWSALGLAAAVWVSSAIFGLYIIAAYIGDALSHALPRWNDMLPGLYDARTPVATGGMGMHILAGSVLLTLGFLQLLAPLRERFPAAHRWIGRVYVFAALAAGVGGLAFIAIKGTIGGFAMNVGFGLYGALTVLAAVQTYRFARARGLDAHRSWAIRLFALVVGSWLYRMDYGFWFIAANGIGHTHGFRGPFDAFMAFWFYLPNLLVAEWVIRPRRRRGGFVVNAATTLACALACIVVLVGTYYFTKFYWGPAILARF